MEKMTINKRALMIASSIAAAAIPLTIALIAVSQRERKHKLLQSKGFLEQTNPKMSVITTIPVHREQQKEKSKAEPNSAWQGSETRAATMTTATISTSTTVADKDVITVSEAVPSPIVPSSTSDSAVIVSSSSSSSQTSKEEEISVSDEARKAGESLKELAITAIKEAKDSTTRAGKQLKEQTIDIAATDDSKDIYSLEDKVNVLVGLFENTMGEIRKERYDEQIKLLDRYKDLLRTQIKVADARRRMASKLKPGA